MIDGKLVKQIIAFDIELKKLKSITCIQLVIMIAPYSLLDIEILVQIIFQKYLANSFCLTIVSETPLQFNIPISFTYISPNDSQYLFSQLLEVSEMGCSDYIVRMNSPQSFMAAFEKVSLEGSIRRSDRKIVFLPFVDNTSNDLLKILSLKETRFVPNILLILPSPEKLAGCTIYDLITHKYIGVDETVHLPEYLDRWNSCSTYFERNSNLFPHDMTNLYGKTVKVACFTYKPYVLLDLDKSLSPLGRDGTEMKMIDEFCRWINCTVEVVRDDVHQWGEIYENHTGVGVLGNVVEDRADLGISALYSWYEEYVSLDFSAASIRTGISCIAPAPRLLASWEMPVLPFSLYMWLALLFTFIYASIGLTVAQGCSSNSAFLTTFGIMITQSQNNNAGKNWRIRYVTGWLLITGLVLDNAYSAGLASTFTVPKYEQSIDTIQDIVDRKMEWGATHDAWIFSLALSQEPLIQQLISQFRIHEAEELKRKSFTRSMAFSIEKLPAGYFAIGEYITEEAVLDLRLMLEDFYYEQCVVMMRKSSPYTVKISEFIGRLHGAGLLLAWERQVALKHLNFKVQLEVKLSRSKQDVDVEALSFRHVEGIFFFYVAGLTASLLVFSVEIVLKGRKNKKLLNNYKNDALIH